MMKLTKKQITCLKKGLFLVSLFALTACEYRTVISNNCTIDNAGLLVQENPDSTLKLLEPIQTGLLNPLYYARYQIINTWAKSKLNMSITLDTDIFLARDYLIEYNDKYAAGACFVTAGIYRDNHKTSLAVADYNKACELLQNSDDHLLKGSTYYNLAREYYGQKLYLESLHYTKKAQQCFNLIKLEKYSSYIYEMIGLNYLFTHETDSAMCYFDKALAINSDSYNQGNLYGYISIALRNAAQYPEAKHKCFEAMRFASDSLLIGQLHLILATVYDKTNQADSAYLSAYQAKPSIDKAGHIVDRIDLYNLLFRLELERGNREQATFYKGKYEGYIDVRDQSDKAVREEQQKRRQEDTQAIQEKLNRSLIQTLVLRNTLIILVSVMAVALGIFFFHKYRKKQKARIDEIQEKHGNEIGKYEGKIEGYANEIGKYEDEIESYVDKIGKYENKIEKYEGEIERYADKIEEERQQLEEERQQHEHVVNSFNNEIRQQLRQYEQQIKLEKKKINQQRLSLISRVRDLSSLWKLAYDHQAPAAVKSEINRLKTQYHGWEVVRQIIDNDMYDGLLDRMRADFPGLTDPELYTCYLLAAGLDLVVISDILGEDKGTTRNRTTTIREKLNLPSRSNLNEFFCGKYPYLC